MVLEYLPVWVDADVRAATSLAAPLEAAVEKQRAQDQLPAFSRQGVIEPPYSGMLGNALCMVLLCLPGVHVDNVLALRTLEHRLAQHVFPQNGKLVCMWNVVDMVALAEPFAGVPAGLGASRQRSVVWRLNHLSRDAAAATSCKDTGRSVRDQLVLWQQRFGLEDPLPLPEHVLSLPLQIAVLVSRGSWKVVYGAYPKHRRDARRHWCIFSGIQISDDVHLEERCDVLQRDEVVRICDAIRDVAPGANLAAQQTLERLARWADSLYSSMYEVGHASSKKKRGGPFLAKFLLDCFFLSGQLRSSRRLKKAVMLALRCALPEEMVESLVARVMQMDFPSNSTVSRWNLTVDTAYMLWWRTTALPKLLDMVAVGTIMAETDAPLFCLCDSSPQGGQDWFLAELRGIGRIGKDRSGVFEEYVAAGDFMDAHNELTEKMEVAARRPHGQPLREFLGREAFDEIVALQEALAENSFSHLLPLMGLASGHTSLDDKVHALMYALHHEVGRAQSAAC